MFKIKCLNCLDSQCSLGVALYVCGTLYMSTLNQSRAKQMICMYVVLIYMTTQHCMLRYRESVGVP